MLKSGGSQLAVDGGGKGCEQDFVEAADAGVAVAGKRDDPMPLEAMHELMRHHAIGAE